MSWCMADVIEMNGDPGFRSCEGVPWDEGTPVIFPDQDPTGRHAVPMGEGELLPTPQQSGMTHSQPVPADSGKPFIRPPEERKPGKPFLTPPDQQKPSKPFINPPGQPQPDPFGRPAPASQTGIQHGQMYVLPPQGPQLPTGSGPYNGRPYNVVAQPPPYHPEFPPGPVAPMPQTPYQQPLHNVDRTATLPAYGPYPTPVIQR